MLQVDDMGTFTALGFAHELPWAATYDGGTTSGGFCTRAVGYLQRGGYV